MAPIKSFSEFLYEREEVGNEETLKKKVLDYAEQKGKTTWKELQEFLVKLTGNQPSRETRGRFSSYFSGGSSWVSDIRKFKSRNATSHGLLMRPTKKDPRYLEKEGKYYVVKHWDGKTPLPM